MTIPIQPLKDLILIEVEDKDAAKVLPSGITIPPKQWAQPSNRAKVIATGKEVKLHSEIHDGDIVMINPYAVQDTDKKLIKLIREKDVLAICQE